MPAPKHNEYWKKRKSHGPKPLWSDPETLRKDCIDYFEWVEANPLYEERLFTYKGKVISGQLKKMRAMTLTGLCIHLGISLDTWLNYKAKPVFSEIIEFVEAVIYDYKFTGAAAGLLNHAIIARDLGLADKKEVDVGMSHEQWLKLLEQYEQDESASQ